MAKCVKLRRQKTEVCIGNMNRKIEIYQRVLTSPLNAFTSDNPDYSETEVVIATVWAMIQTPKGKTIFDEVSTSSAITDIFYIRYISELTSENWIIYNNNRYDIASIINLDENRLYMKLNGILRGSADREASQA